MPRMRCVFLSALVVLVAACGTPPAASPTLTSPPLAKTARATDGPAPSSSASTPVGERSSGYDQPSQAILDVLRAPTPPRPYVDPTGATILLASWLQYPPMARVAEPFLRLAGVRVEPRTRRKHDTSGGYGISPCARDFTLVDVQRGSELRIALPAGGCADAPLWSADGKRVAFRNTSADAVELWVADGKTGEAHRVGDLRVNPMLSSNTMQWMPDQKTMLVKLVPDNAGPPPSAPVVLDGPSIQETNGQKGESSTYEARDTLTGKHDEDLFDYYASAQLALVDMDTGRATRVGAPAILADVDVAPDGEHILVQSVRKPYSYVTTWNRFPHVVEIWDRSGKITHAVAALPLADRVPVHGVPTGPRDFDWRSTEPATLTWAEALDGGDWKAKVPARDKVLMHKAPFTTAPVEIARTEQRYTGISWGEQPSLALLREDDENRHWTRTFTMNVDAPATKPKVLFDLSTDEHYKHPGSPVMRRLPTGPWVVRQSGTSIYLAGDGSSPDGDRPFLDRLDLATQKTERLFRSDKTAYDWFVGFTTDPTNATFLTWHQSPSDPPNAFVRTLAGAQSNAAPGEPAFASAPRALTHLPDPTPAVRSIKKRLVKYKRKDGMDLSFTLYTPPGYQEGTRIPAVLYAYPLDYADASKAGQVTGSEQTFTRLDQYRLLLLAGYAIIDRAAFPIVGDPKKAYDHYLEQLVADAAAAVEKAVALGVVDPERVGVTGHSHGALMTVNLLAHSELFRAGVATSGSYNKTLTPFGFQNERRSVWDAQRVYLEASPFFFADKLKLPLLLVHGADDANPGTTPLQASKLYEAVRGNGGTTRLVMLPHEPHWYTAMESNEQLAYEMIRWFDLYVKNAPPRAKAK
ncbi:MAG: peptidase prolyl oligopeptidase [Myxococcaceae bacterium]|nr:peptidase prolyl oligopeptidase [Myxococcaceae bacterium]